MSRSSVAKRVYVYIFYSYLIGGNLKRSLQWRSLEKRLQMGTNNYVNNDIYINNHYDNHNKNVIFTDFVVHNTPAFKCSIYGVLSKSYHEKPYLSL